MKSIESNHINKILLLFISLLSLWGCQEEVGEESQPDQVPEAEKPFELTDIRDSYGEISSFQFASYWGPYNVHDPSVLKDGDWFYSYSTDVAYGQPISRVGIQIRRSRDLVEWEFVGWALNGRPAQAVDYIRRNGVEPFGNVWAPYIIRVGNEYRLYYSLASERHKLSATGLLVADSPTGPWSERGLVVTSNTHIPMTNAIDPAVIIDKTGAHWMYYGSAFDGIYVMELDPSSGLAKTDNDKGFRIAQRGFSGTNINGNIEAPEVIFNEATGFYYLFLSYDWLETKYNIRVGRSENPTGPFLDYNGNDMNGKNDDIPMIVAPYQFQGHSGWQGVAHNAVFRDGDTFYIAHQGRPAADKFYMIMHVRKLYWTDDGWPLASPQRFANLETVNVNTEDLVGNWEEIVLNYRIIPGYADEQFLPDMQQASDLVFNADGSIGNEAGQTWTYAAPWLTVNRGDGNILKVFVDNGYDWENHKPTILFTGLDQKGTAIWGKKK
ncbi:arabinan endo-1,5-alpha-L-arabinosidase [Anditalea andensis]|uniref:Beta-xylosidase n=1 Tax=Anditalea andensis TaxID=1048983 RepID=A0A074KZS3_9BACT|nr:arabinan endo-1,5-alpha-L-arabinosidase [Anditalea andensis]KEO74434.1 beta-xylosidase [Anditalea andensis]